MIPGEACHTVDTRGLNGLGEGHRRQDGGELSRQYRRAHARGAEQEEIMVTTPASGSALPELAELLSGIIIDPPSKQKQ
jgi:hypothetical protein